MSQTQETLRAEMAELQAKMAELRAQAVAEVRRLMTEAGLTLKDVRPEPKPRKARAKKADTAKA